MLFRSRIAVVLLGCAVSLPALASTVTPPASPTAPSTSPTAPPAGTGAQTVFDAVAMSPDGMVVATITHDAAHGHAAQTVLTLRPVSGGAGAVVALPCAGDGCHASAPGWSHDGRHLVFVLQQPDSDAQELWQTDAHGNAPQRLLVFDGLLDTPRFSPGGALSVLAVAHPHKKTGATAAAASLSGEIGTETDEQRLALVQNNALRFVSPASLYVYEYDWRPDGSGFIATAAPGDGDANWWVAKLHALGTDGSDHVLFTPGVSQQLADPLVAPDGKSVAFVGGLMSDFGSTGGDAFRLDLRDGAVPVNLTPGAKASVTALSFNCGGGQLAGTLLHGDRFELAALDAPGADPRVLMRVEAGHSVSLGGGAQAVSCGGNAAATSLNDFTHDPVLAAARAQPDGFGALVPLDPVRPAAQPAIAARSLHWRSDGFDVQGWLLEPTGASGNAGRRPLIVSVHGGPSAASMPRALGQGYVAPLLAAGYDVLLPNPRGSFGQGEAFTHANFRDQGHGPLRDILAGVDAAEKAADPAHPIDEKRLGLFGYSYGGYMAMWAPTETDRFRAIVAGAGVSDWLSIEGEEGIATSDIPFFGVSVYVDPKPYLDASPILRMRNIHTPVFSFVGDRDIECPMPQSQEYDQALRMLNKPTQFVVYAGQGHGMANDADRRDAQKRTLDWFAKWFAKAG